MNLNLQSLQLLNKFSKKTIHQLTLDDISEMVEVVGVNADPSTLHKILGILSADDEKMAADWILEPGNQTKVLESLKPPEEKLTVACPTCDELALYGMREVGQVNPHLICRFCSAIIPLDAD
jgi:hypothetical protein